MQSAGESNNDGQTGKKADTPEENKLNNANSQLKESKVSESAPTEQTGGDQKDNTPKVENPAENPPKAAENPPIKDETNKATDNVTVKEESKLTKDENVAKEEEMKKNKRNGKKSPAARQTKLPSCSLPNNMQPTFYVGGGNGVSLVEAPLLGLGWKRTSDKYDERFRLKWVECKTRINYSAFKEGDQLVNHIPNGNLLTNKLGLLNSLQEYERVTLSTKGRPPRLRFTDFVPETYRFDEKHDREMFLERYKDNELWICKPTGMNQGKGIFIIRSKEELMKLIEERELKKEQLSKSSRPMMTRIVQRYITNPLLLDERKFDIRAYMLIASTTPYLVLYHKGYVRLCCNKYIEDSKEMSTHLTNQFVQKKDPNYKDVKEDTAWSMDKFNQYINENVREAKGLEEDWVYNTLTKQMQKIMIHCFNSVKHKLQSRIGFFDLFGLDFMVDTDMKVYLIEVNVNPALHINCEALKEVIPGVVEETLYVTIECFEKTRKSQPLLPLNSLKNFSVLYCGSRPYNVPARNSRSVSPTKDMSNDKRGSLPNTATGAAPRTAHRMGTTSTPVVSAPPVVSEANTKPAEPEPVRKQPVIKDVHIVPNPSAKLSDMVSFSSASLLAEAGNLLSQTSHAIEDTVKLKNNSSEVQETEDKQKLKKEDSNLQEKANSLIKSQGVVLNLSPLTKEKSVVTLDKSNTLLSVDSQGSKTNTSKPKPARISLSTSGPLSSVVPTSAKTTITSTSSDNDTPGNKGGTSLVEITPKQANPYVIMTTTTSSNPITAKNVSSFPVITNNSATSKSARQSHPSGKSIKDSTVRQSSSGGLSSNPYSFNNPSGKMQGAAVYLNTATTKSLNVTGSNVISTANLKMTSTSSYSKPMSVPSVTISESGSKTIATLTLTNSKSGPPARSDLKSGLRRSRDRDKPDRGN